MEDLLVHNFEVQSHSGQYHVEFNNNIMYSDQIAKLGTHYIIDKSVFPLLNERFYSAMNEKNCILITATEENKSYQGIEPIITQLIDQGLRRDSHLVAIGGGITQDITCFIATTFMRGVNWTFVPTTLLAQADSCIGSKSSINFGRYKNILGTFTPPNKIVISNEFLHSLSDDDFKSGVGEIIKLLIVDGQIPAPESISRENIDQYVLQALLIKKCYIEIDEFDKGPRQILNYGHCIGHGIESATNFNIPHGIAITMGMDVANKFAYLENLITSDQYNQMHRVLFANYKEFAGVFIDTEKVCQAMTKDKKNTGSKINLILPVDSTIEKRGFENTSAFWLKIHTALAQVPITTRS
jgi:3-dehydroquinate synthase